MRYIKCYAKPYSLTQFDSSCDGGAEVVVAVAQRGEDVSYFTTSAPSEGWDTFNNL